MDGTLRQESDDPAVNWQAAMPPADAETEERLDLCEGCQAAPIERVLEMDPQVTPYRVCAACAVRLENLALRPREWFNLAAIHGPTIFLLHDDYYDQEGVTGQPQRPVEDAELFPMPALSEVRDQRERLIDYAMTRYFLTDEVTAALRQHPGEAVLRSLQARLARYNNLWIEARAYGICASVLGSVAEDWIRGRWAVYRLEILFPLVEATAACLPVVEGYGRVTQVLETVPPAELGDLCLVLACFRSDQSLDWIEAHAGAIVNRWRHVPETWGHLAALSHLSWPRVTAWLDQGRPLSLVALDALLALFHYNTRLLVRLAPQLLEPALPTVMAAALQAYAVRDPVPRVERAVGWLVAKLSA